MPPHCLLSTAAQSSHELHVNERRGVKHRRFDSSLCQQTPLRSFYMQRASFPSKRWNGFACHTPLSIGYYTHFRAMGLLGGSKGMKGSL